MSITEQALQPDPTNTGLPELAGEIKACIAAGDEAKAKAKGAKAEATRQFMAAGKLLIEAHGRTPNFRAFLKEHCITPSRAYELIKIAGGEVEKVRADGAERKRRQRARTNGAGVRDIGIVTDTASELRAPDAGEAGTASQSAEAPVGEALNAQLCPEPEVEEGELAPDTASGPPEASAPSRAVTKPSAKEAKCNFKFAVDHWWPSMDDAGRAEMTVYFHNKAGVRVS